eukprot:5058382-Amphidinium_carterae.1
MSVHTSASGAACGVRPCVSARETAQGLAWMPPGAEDDVEAGNFQMSATHNSRTRAHNYIAEPRPIDSPEGQSPNSQNVLFRWGLPCSRGSLHGR